MLDFLCLLVLDVSPFFNVSVLRGKQLVFDLLLVLLSEVTLIFEGLHLEPLAAKAGFYSFFLMGEVECIRAWINHELLQEGTHQVLG